MPLITLFLKRELKKKKTLSQKRKKRKRKQKDDRTIFGKLKNISGKFT